MHAKNKNTVLTACAVNLVKHFPTVLFALGMANTLSNHEIWLARRNADAIG